MAAGLDRATDPIRNAGMLVDYTNGYTVLELAEDSQLSPSTINTILKSMVSVICLTKRIKTAPRLDDVHNNAQWHNMANAIHKRMLS